MENFSRSKLDDILVEFYFFALYSFGKMLLDREHSAYPTQWRSS